MEIHIYSCMASFGLSMNFSWSRWNFGAGSRTCVFLMRELLEMRKLVNIYCNSILCCHKCSNWNLILLAKSIERSRYALFGLSHRLHGSFTGLLCNCSAWWLLCRPISSDCVNYSARFKSTSGLHEPDIATKHFSAFEIDPTAELLLGRLWLVSGL